MMLSFGTPGQRYVFITVAEKMIPTVAVSAAPSFNVQPIDAIMEEAVTPASAPQST
jgi:hypothetical protein